LSLVNRAFLWVLTRFSSQADTSALWRLCSRLLFSEMRLRQWRGPLSARPYVQFERYFANSPEQLERFQNFIAGNEIFVDLLAANWFEYLSIKDRVPVTSLFRRIYEAENVWLSYRNRPAIVDRIQTLDNVDQDSLPEEVFIAPERSISGGMVLWLAVSKLFTAFWATIEASISAIFKAIDRLFSSITLVILAIPLVFASLLMFMSPSIGAWVTRNKIHQLVGLKPNSKKIGNLLSRYETRYANDAKNVQKIANLLKKPSFRPLFTENNLDSLEFKNRVLVTSLYRRCAEADAGFKSLVENLTLTDAISVKNQRDVAQLTRPNKQQKAEWKIFKKNNPGNKHKHGKTEGSLPAAVKRPVRASLPPTSESVLQKEGWFSPSDMAAMQVATALRERAYGDATKLINSSETFDKLSQNMKVRSAAVMALLQKPFTHNVVDLGIDQDLLVPPRVTNRAAKAQADAAFVAATKHLYTAYEGEAARSPLACWTTLESVLDDDTEFSYAAEILTAAYSDIPFRRISDRSVSFDIFLVLRLEEILEKIRLWVDWDACPPAALTAYAYAAAMIGDKVNFDFFIATLDGFDDIPQRFVINLRDSFYKYGLHRIDAVLSPTSSLSAPSHLRTLDKDKKYLCLVERGARIQVLRHIEGVSGNLTCGPVAPVDAIKYPPAANLVQAEDFIPIYSTEDMEIGLEVDRLTEHYLEHAADRLRESGVAKLYENGIEIAHALVFLALYRSMISARICEKLMERAKDYDGIILLTKTGDILGNMIAPAIKAVGSENVYVSLGSRRADEFFSALTTMRAFAKTTPETRPVKAKPKLENPDAWMVGMTSWISETVSFHSKTVRDLKPGPYSIMGFEQVNGFYDSYRALIREGLPHSNVELFSSSGNVQLHNHMLEGGFAPYENDYELRHCVLRRRAPDSRNWVTPFVQSLREGFDDIKSPYLPMFKNLFVNSAESALAQRLPQSMDAISYFRTRFDKGLPDYVFTAPSQHMISRAAAYCAKASGVPSYDFLILANTNHPRYRPIIADYAYLYDPWYKEIYQSFFGMKEEQLRTAGPLFEYSDRLKQAPNADYAAPRGKTHIVFFSQSANFDNSKLMLEAICQATNERKDIYITLKLHPHESPANVGRYTQIAADNGIKGNIHVFHQGDAVALLNQADLVVQSFSNIGLDALLLKKPVITFKPKTDLKARIFLYEKDIGYVVSTKRTLTNKIKKFLKDPQDRLDMQKIADKFAEENDHFLRGQNAARVMQSVQEDLRLLKRN